MAGRVSSLTLVPETGMSRAECIRRPTVPLRARDPLAAEHGGTWEDPPMAGNRVLVIVVELEISLPQFEQRHVGDRTYIERATVSQLGLLVVPTSGLRCPRPPP